MYYYITNLQGDVMQLVNSSGTAVATYEYDPYGNIVSTSGTMASTNPLRYRGYYFDQETELYYLQSRYYDPQIGRFINADALVSTGQGLLGNNMFAYCGNNPVCRVDPIGHFFLPVAIDLFDEWLHGDGSDKNFGKEEEVSRKLKNHKKTKNVVKKAIDDYKSGAPKEEWNHGTLYYGASDDLDLWLAARNCEYNLDIKEEQRTLDFWLFKVEQVRYVVAVTVHDKYDFTEQPWDGVGNYLNNYAMIAHDYLGVGKDYDWYATFTYTTAWETVG